jgi:hypothetical protein
MGSAIVKGQKGKKGEQGKTTEPKAEEVKDGSSEGVKATVRCGGV